MIELRWVERKVYSDGNLVDRVQIGWKTVLQCRTKTEGFWKSHTISTIEWIEGGWSDWTDVPVVKDGA